MKLSRKLVPAIAMLLVSAVMLSTASFAWFSMNTTVTAKNMKVQATAMGSLIIHTAIPDAAISTNEVDFIGVDPTSLTDATHYAASPSGLATIPETKRAGVDAVAGTYPALDADAITAGTYEVVEIAAGAGQYYVDYPVYLAARSTSIDDVNDLQVTLSTSDSKYYSAVAVDFYVYDSADSVPAAGTECKGTAHLKSGENVVTSIYQGTIPVAKDTAGTLPADQGYIKVIMRVYIDGAKAAVNNANWTAEPVAFNATFKLVPVTP